MYVILALILLGGSIAPSGKSGVSILRRFCIAETVLFIMLFAIGGGIVLNDALNGTTVANGDIWIAFMIDMGSDGGGSAGIDAGLGINSRFFRTLKRNEIYSDMV